MNKMNALEANNPSIPRFTWIIMQRSAGYVLSLPEGLENFLAPGQKCSKEWHRVRCDGRNWMAARRSPLHPGDTAKSAKLRERSRCCRRWWVHVHGKLHALVKCLVSLKQLAYAPFGVVHFQHRADLSEARRKLRQLQFLFLQFVPWTPRSSDLCSTALAVGPSCCYRLAYRFGLASPWKRRNNLVNGTRCWFPLAIKETAKILRYMQQRGHEIALENGHPVMNEPIYPLVFRIPSEYI